MSKNKKYQFTGTVGDIIDLIKSLPPAPTQVFLETWYEFVVEKNPVYYLHREFYHKITKLSVRFDVKQEGKPGFEGKDHWHIYNPFTKGKIDLYYYSYEGYDPSKLFNDCTPEILQTEIADDGTLVIYTFEFVRYEPGEDLYPVMKIKAANVEVAELERYNL